MTRVHDMGGRYGDGPINPDPDAPAFETDWHARALAVTLAAGALGEWSIDTSRHARESLPPKDYTSFSYYEKWLAALANLLVERGLITRDELASGTASPEPGHPKMLEPRNTVAALARHVPYSRPGPASAYQIGDRVRTRLPARNTSVEGGHTRLPAYLAGHIGRVIHCHGAHVLPDKNAHRLGEAPEPLYTIAFTSSEIWGASMHPGDDITADLWQSYLEPA